MPFIVLRRTKARQHLPPWLLACGLAVLHFSLRAENINALPELPGETAGRLKAAIPRAYNPNYADPRWSDTGLQDIVNGANGQTSQFGIPVRPVSPVSVGLGDYALVTTAPASTGLQYRDKTSLFDVTLGAGYMRPDRRLDNKTPFAASARAAALVGSNLALGANLAYSKAWTETVLNAAYQLPGVPLLLSTSGGYAIGTQNFQFGDKSLNAKLGQSSFVAGADYILPAESSLGLHSVGLRAWAAQARQRSADLSPPTTSLVETDTQYLLLTRNYKLALGRLQGASIGGQYAIAENFVVKGSFGLEYLKYPFSDGSAEKTRSVYRSVEGFYQPAFLAGVILGMEYKSGVAENRVAVSALYEGLSVSAFVNQGMHGNQGNRGAMFNYTLPLGGGAGRSNSLALAERMRPASSDYSTFLLNAAATRPKELPRLFLAKVDNTANRCSSIDKAFLSDGVKINAQGMAIVPVGPQPLLNNVTRNGAVFDHRSLFSIVGSDLLLNVPAFPMPAATDHYIANLTDAAGASYQVLLTGNAGPANEVAGCARS